MPKSSQAKLLKKVKIQVPAEQSGAGLSLCSMAGDESAATTLWSTAKTRTS
jgi:hypothetical protein